MSLEHHANDELGKRIARIGDQFAICGDFLYGEELRNGHINTTYRACYRTEDGHEDRYILQRINDYVFKDPAQVMRNVEKVTRHIMWKLLRRRRNAAGQTSRSTPPAVAATTSTCRRKAACGAATTTLRTPTPTTWWRTPARPTRPALPSARSRTSSAT